jgi:NTP pyrophosphatase (non-canonical NTP hydrolase)|tara:strand:+ start:234 stop:602 length:369 start_codon:yes stop_codon:yes gene_type:complete
MKDFSEVTHAEMVLALAKPGRDIVLSLTNDQAHLLHMAVGIAGEAGELLDAVKKHVIYNKSLDVVNIVEELGDLEFYMEGLRQSDKVGVSRDATLRMNKEKLSKRYHTLTYTDTHAQERRDK